MTMKRHHLRANPSRGLGTATRTFISPRRKSRDAARLPAMAVYLTFQCAVCEVQSTTDTFGDHA